MPGFWIEVTNNKIARKKVVVALRDLQKERCQSPLLSSSSSLSNSTTPITITTTVTNNGPRLVSDSKKVYIIQYRSGGIFERLMMSPEHVHHPYPINPEK